MNKNENFIYFYAKENTKESGQANAAVKSLYSSTGPIDRSYLLLLSGLICSTPHQHAPS
jgi:hypothetical protein